MGHVYVYIGGEKSRVKTPIKLTIFLCKFMGPSNTYQDKMKSLRYPPYWSEFSPPCQHASRKIFTYFFWGGFPNISNVFYTIVFLLSTLSHGQECSGVDSQCDREALIVKMMNYAGNCNFQISSRPRSNHCLSTHVRIWWLRLVFFKACILQLIARKQLLSNQKWCMLTFRIKKCHILTFHHKKCHASTFHDICFLGLL